MSWVLCIQPPIAPAASLTPEAKCWWSSGMYKTTPLAVAWPMGSVPLWACAVSCCTHEVHRRPLWAVWWTKNTTCEFIYFFVFVLVVTWHAVRIVLTRVYSSLEKFLEVGTKWNTLTLGLLSFCMQRSFSWLLVGINIAWTTSEQHLNSIWTWVNIRVRLEQLASVCVVPLFPLLSFPFLSADFTPSDPMTVHLFEKHFLFVLGHEGQHDPASKRVCVAWTDLEQVWLAMTVVNNLLCWWLCFDCLRPLVWSHTSQRHLSLVCLFLLCQLPL